MVDFFLVLDRHSKGPALNRRMGKQRNDEMSPASNCFVRWWDRSLQWLITSVMFTSTILVNKVGGRFEIVLLYMFCVPITRPTLTMFFVFFALGCFLSLEPMCLTRRGLNGCQIQWNVFFLPAETFSHESRERSSCVADKIPKEFEDFKLCKEFKSSIESKTSILFDTLRSLPLQPVQIWLLSWYGYRLSKKVPQKPWLLVKGNINQNLWS